MQKNLLRKIVYVTFFSAVVCLSACGDLATETPREDSVKGLFSRCENTFVVSGSRKIYLFEHHPNSVDFDQLAVFDDWSPLSAYLDCEHNRMVVPYGARKDDRNNAGVAIIDLITGDKIDYTADNRGIQGVGVKYDNGLLLSTTLLRQENLPDKPPSYGYLPPGENYRDRHGKNYRLFTPTTFFDLSRLEFTQELDLDLGYSVIENGTLYARQRGAITAIDLRAKTTNILAEFKADRISKTSGIPLNHLGVFLDGQYYMVLNRFGEQNINGFDRNGIYKLVNGEMRQLASYADGDAVYLLGLENKLYLFTQSLQVIEYDLKTQVLVRRSPMNLVGLSGYRIESVGFNHQNFVLALSHYKNDMPSQVLLISRDFTQFSVAKPVDIRMISITTDLAIDTADSRGVQPPMGRIGILK